MSTNKPGFNDFRDANTGMPVFTDGSARERLAATLNSKLTSGPTIEQQREDASAKARAEVDANWPQDKMVAAVNRVIAAGNAHTAALAQAKADMRPDRYFLAKGNADERLAQYLLDETNAFKGIVESGQQRNPKTVRPFPVTSPDIAALSIRLNQLDSATPAEAQGQIEDGIQRSDLPFLTAAAANLRSWKEYRNSWQGTPAQSIANDLLAQIDGQIWTPDGDAAQYAQDRADASIRAWTQLVRLVQNDQSSIPVFKSTGALEPLIARDA